MATTKDVVALSTTPSQLVWYRNPGWQRYTVTTQTKLNIDMAPYDVDGDGDQDLALASEFDLNNSTTGGTGRVWSIFSMIPRHNKNGRGIQ